MQRVELGLFKIALSNSRLFRRSIVPWNFKCSAQQNRLLAVDTIHQSKILVARAQYTVIDSGRSPPKFGHEALSGPYNPEKAPAMFHEGDLQSGIALAVQQAKSVLCFVRGELPGPTLSCFGRLSSTFRRIVSKRGLGSRSRRRMS